MTMKRWQHILLTCVAVLFGANPSWAQSNAAPSGASAAPNKTAPATQASLKDTVYLDLKYGRVVIKLHPELAPKTVARFEELVRQHFYDGLKFHRVIDGFMAQTGDPRGDGTGGSGKNIVAEFNSGQHVRGALSMARAEDINSADSQFFIVLADASFLNGKYTYFGEVVSGMEFVDMIRKGDRGLNGAVAMPDQIVRMQMAGTKK